MRGLSQVWHAFDGKTFNEQIEGRFNRSQRLILSIDLEHYFILESPTESVTIWMDRNSQNWMIHRNEVTRNMTSYMELKGWLGE